MIFFVRVTRRDDGRTVRIHHSTPPSLYYYSRALLRCMFSRRSRDSGLGENKAHNIFFFFFFLPQFIYFFTDVCYIKLTQRATY